MTKLLRVDTSARSSASVSRSLADTFESAWRERLPDSDVVVRDLVTASVPHVPAEIVPRSLGEPVQSPAAQFQDTLVDEVLVADAVLVSTPMYNLGVPSALKAWIDHILLVGRTLPSPGEPPPTSGIPVTVVAAYGGGYGPGTPRDGWDHLKPYLTAVFDGILGMEVAFVTVELTLAATAPGMEGLIALADRSATAGHAAARARAQQVAASLRPAGDAPRAGSVAKAS